MQTAAKGIGGIFYEVVGDVVRFPIWWYTAGVIHTIQSLVRWWQHSARTLAIAVWIKNLFVPMYGQYNIQGRIISVVVRGAQIVFRGMALLCMTLVLVAAFAVYIGLPLIAFAFSLFHATGGIFGLYVS